MASTDSAGSQTDRYLCHGEFDGFIRLTDVPRRVSSFDAVQPNRVSGIEIAVARAQRQRAVWAMGAAILIVLGITGAVAVAATVTRDGAQKSRQAFTESSAEIASTLKLAIQHEQDLIVSTAGFVVGNPNASETEFIRWADSVSALERYPELFGFGESVIVPASRLKAFEAKAMANPSAPLGPGGTFQVKPPGKRAFYCFSQLGQSRQTAGPPVGYDFCAGDQGAAALADRNSGHGDYVPIVFGKTTLLAVQTPVYRGGTVPSTVASRKAEFIGWIGVSVVPDVLLEVALEGRPGTAVTLRFGGGTSNVVFVDGTAPRGWQHTTINLHNGWTVETYASASGEGMFANAGALGLLVTGIAVSLLLGLLVFILGTSRSRALALVSQKTDELRYQALHDPLTGLPNRLLITDRIEQLLARNRRSGTTAAAMYIDLDDFKNVNDTLGHAAGDQLLRAVAARLSGTLREVDTIGRIGGDEFVVLIDSGRLDTAPEFVAERLLEVMRQPFELDAAPMPLTVTVSVGIAVADRNSRSELLRDADVALYLAKSAGKNCFEVFQPAMETNIRRIYELEFDLRCALEHHQFRLVYQPIYSLDDLSLLGVEALLRWDHPTMGEIQPGEFVPLLESSGRIIEVGRWVLIEACRQTASWRARAGTNIGVSVNVSGRQLDHDFIVDDVKEALMLSGLAPTVLTIEITETALMRDTETAAKRLRELKKIGVRLSIDDFGTGYSSLAYLAKFPVDCLKIDRAFTSAISNSTESRALVRTLVQLGRDLGLTTIAEGVETAEQIDRLRDEHVDQAQGFLMARPLEPDVFATTMLGLSSEVVVPPA
jgi:diguanylate cyclase (GGDEF)-like protein